MPVFFPLIGKTTLEGCGRIWLTLVGLLVILLLFLSYWFLDIFNFLGMDGEDHLLLVGIWLWYFIFHCYVGICFLQFCPENDLNILSSLLLDIWALCLCLALDLLFISLTWFISLLITHEVWLCFNGLLVSFSFVVLSNFFIFFLLIFIFIFLCFSSFVICLQYAWVCVSPLEGSWFVFDLCPVLVVSLEFMVQWFSLK